MLPLFLIFVLIIILIRIKAPIGLALLGAAIFLGIYHFGIHKDFWLLIYHSLIDLTAWKLIATVSLILTFAYIFESAGFVDSMVSSLESFLSPRWVARAGPAIIGLLPMPGGAMVSAPIVRKIGEGSDVTPEQFTAANYWWRHIWETSWPLYPSIILAAAVLNVSVWDVTMINFPISLACIATGFLLKQIGSPEKSANKPNIISLIKSLWPILFVVILGLGFRVDILISVMFVTIVVIIAQRIPKRMVFDSLKKGFEPSVVALIFGVMTLMAAIEKTGVAAEFYQQLLYYHIPSSVVVFAVPFTVGLLTGVTSAYIGVGFPVVAPLLGTPGLSQSAGLLLAFTGGFMGVMASPVHLCLVLTNQYFKASLAKTISLLIVPIILTSILSWVLAMIVYH